jgi:hypothetical protein
MKSSSYPDINCRFLRNNGGVRGKSPCISCKCFLRKYHWVVTSENNVVITSVFLVVLYPLLLELLESFGPFVFNLSYPI